MIKKTFNNGLTLSVDENECDSKPCGRGTCINSVGSYRCNCQHGYELVMHNGKRKCIGE